ncbi:MAG TPA: helix-turn-helix domain-containing protein [Cellulomonas sp.]
MPRDGSETRRRIVTAAMRRFVEHGYDKTSLREIADDVGVTKAALYYHFRTKEEIAAAGMADFAGAVTSLQEWASAREPGHAGDAELVERLVRFVADDAGAALRFAQANPTVVAGSDDSVRPADAMSAIVRAVAGEGAGTEGMLRSLLAVGAVMLTSLGDTPLPIPGDDTERGEAARRVAVQLLGGIPRPATRPGRTPPAR